jgi:hypothetical protein
MAAAIAAIFIVEAKKTDHRIPRSFQERMQGPGPFIGKNIVPVRDALALTERSAVAIM